MWPALRFPDVDGHILEAQTTDDDASRALRFGDVEAEIIGWVPVIPLATFPINSVEQAKVRGIAPLPTGTLTSHEPGLLEKTIGVSAHIGERNKCSQLCW